MFYIGVIINKYFKKMAKKILLVEDEEDVADVYSLSLSNHGYEVLVAKDGQEGLEVISREKPDLVLLDIILPRKDGFTVLKKIRQNKETKDLPVVLLTNLGQKEDRGMGKKLGALDYLIKAQNTPEQISAKVEKILA